MQTLDFASMGLKELQQRARVKADLAKQSKTWIAAARKEQLASYLSDDVMPETGPAVGTDLAAALQSAMEQVAAVVSAQATPAVDMGAVRELVTTEVERARFPRPVEIRVNDKPAVTIDRAHPVLADVVAALACGLPVWMTGPAGSGKTTVAGHAAKALELDWKALSVSAQTPVSALMGYMDATGKYVRTAFRDVYEHGGLFCLDEADNGNPNVLAVLNAALANGVCSFPDGNIKRHENFRLVACANTFGQGATAQYVGRQQLDAATLDRFVFLVCDYDETLEAEIAGDAEWVKTVQAFRKAADSLKIRTVISPRASIYGAKLLAAGLSREKVEAALIFKGLAEDSVNKLKSAVKA